MAEIHPIRTPAQRKADIVGTIPNGQLVCMSLHRHDFPSDSITAKTTRLPKGMDVRAVSGGSYQITDTCTRCGKKRTVTRTTGFLGEQGTGLKYENPDNWVVIHQDDRDELDISTSTFTAEKFHRVEDLLRRSAKPAAAADDAKPSVPGVRFRGVQ